MYRSVSTCFNVVHSLLSPPPKNIRLSIQSVHSLGLAQSMTLNFWCGLWVRLVCNLIGKCFLMGRPEKGTRRPARSPSLGGLETWILKSNQSHCNIPYLRLILKRSVMLKGCSMICRRKTHLKYWPCFKWVLELILEVYQWSPMFDVIVLVWVGEFSALRLANDPLSPCFFLCDELCYDFYYT